MTPDERTPDERRAAGEALREKVPHKAHAIWEAPADRPDPVALLKEQGTSRVQALLPVRTPIRTKPISHVSKKRLKLVSCKHDRS